MVSAWPLLLSLRFEHVDERASARPAHVLGQAAPGALNLAGARLAPQLLHDFNDLGDARRPDRMALGFDSP